MNQNDMSTQDTPSAPSNQIMEGFFSPCTAKGGSNMGGKNPTNGKIKVYVQVTENRNDVHLKALCQVTC